MDMAKQPQKLRGRPTVLPTWWQLELLVELAKYKDTKPFGPRWSFEKLGEQLAELVDRKLNDELEPWDRKTVERFIDGENPTEELVDAFIALFPHLIKPTFVAASRAEALELRHTSMNFASRPQTELNDQSARLDELRTLRAKLEKDQSSKLESLNARKGDARAAGGGRGRSVGRGRSSSS